MQAAPQREETEWRVQSKRELMPAYRGEAGQQVNIKIMEYSERNVRQLASNEQIINQTNIVNPSNFESTFFLTTLNGLKTWIRFTNHI
ncbi:hypothetical protein [Escherichia coli]|nr:hypothetical protein [Escherichia coli]